MGSAINTLERRREIARQIYERHNGQRASFRMLGAEYQISEAQASRYYKRHLQWLASANLGPDAPSPEESIARALEKCYESAARYNRMALRLTPRDEVGPDGKTVVANPETLTPAVVRTYLRCVEMSRQAELDAVRLLQDIGRIDRVLGTVAAETGTDMAKWLRAAQARAQLPDDMNVSDAERELYDGPETVQ